MKLIDRSPVDVSMQNTSLIQRLTAPHDYGTPVLNPFSFGVSRTGQLSEEALKAVLPIFNFDYMGAAEFEFGAVPEALGKMATLSRDKALVLDSMEIKIKDIKVRERIGGPFPRTWTAHPVYIVGSRDDMDEIKRRIKLIATNESRCMRDARRDPPEGLRVRESVLLGDYLTHVPQYSDHAIGWLELNNGFLFTVDKKMAKGVATLFGIGTNTET